MDNFKSRIRIGVLGAGRWGPNLIRNFDLNRQCEVVAVVDQQESRLRLIRERYPDIVVGQLPDLIFDDKTIDAVVISTPTATHFELTRRALEGKKHVFVEKPLATTGKDCRILCDLAEQAGRTLFVGHVFVYNSGIQFVKDYIRSGELGRVHYIHATRTNLGPIRTDVNALWDLAPHDLSILNYWLDSKPTDVSATGGRFLNREIEDVVFATYTFPDNILANVHVSWLNPKKVREIVIVGEKKMLTWDDMDTSNPIRMYDKKIVFDRDQDEVMQATLVDTFVGFRASIFEGDTLIPKIQINEPLAAECNAFIKAIRDPGSSLSDGEAASLVVHSLEATDQSLREGGKRAAIIYS